MELRCSSLLHEQAHALPLPLFHHARAQLMFLVRQVGNLSEQCSGYSTCAGGKRELSTYIEYFQVQAGRGHTVTIMMSAAPSQQRNRECRGSQSHML